jgi:hypothetical protein
MALCGTAPSRSPADRPRRRRSPHRSFPS